MKATYTPTNPGSVSNFELVINLESPKTLIKGQYEGTITKTRNDTVFKNDVICRVLK